MKLLFENWRKYLNEEELIKEDMGDYYDTLSEDDLYDLDIEDLLDLRDFIEDFGGPGPQSDPKDLYPTIMARIEAMAADDWEDEEPPDREIENLYDGEFILKLMKSFFSSANAGIELAAMIPGAESLSQEFVRIRHHVANLVEYAEDSNDYPWLTLDETEGHPDVLVNHMRLLVKQAMSPNFETEMSEEEEEVLNGYHKLTGSIMHNLRNYAYYGLHHKAPNSPGLSRILPSGGYDKYVNDYKFIKNWVGGETRP